MSELDLLVRGGLAVLPDRLEHLDIGIHDGRIVALEPNLGLKAAAVLEASGLLVFPGVVDAAGWYGSAGAPGQDGGLDFAADSGAFAAGGGGCLVALPHAGGPPLFDKAEFLRRKEEGLATSRLDFALWAAVSPRTVYELDSLRDAGAVGFAAALGPAGRETGLPLPAVPAAILGRAMARAAKLRRPVLVHVEDGFAVARNRAVPGGCILPLPGLARPVETETAGIRLALDLAGEAGCALVLAHVSTAEGCALAAEARARGVDVTVASAPHYLLFDAAEALAPGAGGLFQSVPPLRPAALRDGLAAALAEGTIDLLGSGHRSDGGIAGCQHAFLDLWTRTALNAGFAGAGGAVPGAGPGLAALTTLFTDRAARRLGLERRKGALALGRDADLALLDLSEPYRLGAEELLYARRESAYAGRPFEGRIVRTLQRGRTVYANGALADPAPDDRSPKVAKRGKVCFIRPE